MKTFKELGLHEDILQSVKKIGFFEPTPVQEASIPIILDGYDLIAGSSTGSGKTFAFGAGIIQQIEPGRGVQVLIQVPTRELAEQLLQTFKLFTKNSRVSIVAVYGGVALGPQIKGMTRADIVVGTPGRTLDHLERKTLRLSRVKHIVLDEADRMLDMGFLPDIKKILGKCPPMRQTLLFSATMPHEVAKLAQQFMNNPKRINLAEQVDPSKLKQVTYMLTHPAKIEVLKALLAEEDEKELVIIFCNTRSQVDSITRKLKKDKLKATAIHGGLSQNQRLRVIKQFNSRSNTNILVCTDVAARGLDIPGVSHVYNYDIPREPKQYVHRIGRTARAGADGIAINLVSPRDLANYKQVLRNNSLKIPLQEPPSPEQKMTASEEANAPAKESNGRRNFRSKGSRGGSRSSGPRFSDKRSGASRRASSRSSDRLPSAGKKSFGPKKGFAKKGSRPRQKDGAPFKRVKK